MHTPFSRRTTLNALALGVAALSGLLQGCDSAPMRIKIGVAQPLSGNLAAMGQDLLNGVLLAVEEINKDGPKVDGKPVIFEVVAMDDRANVETGKEVAKQLVDAGVVAVIGHLNSGVSIAAAPIYAQNNIAQLSISTNPKFTALGLSTTFRLVANDTLQAKAMGSYAVTQLKANKYAVLDDSTAYGKDLAAGAIKELQLAKKDVAIQQSFDDKSRTFDDVAAKIKTAGVEVIVSTLSDFQVLALLGALQKINYTNVTVLGSDTGKTVEMLTGSGIANGLYTTSPILEVREFPSGPMFLEKYRNKFKVLPAYAGHYTYDAMHVLAAAIRKTSSAQPAEIVQALHKIDGYAPISGSMKWDDKGEKYYGVIAVYASRGGQWEPRVRSDVW